MSRPLTGALTTTAGACAVIAGLAIIDERVRQQIVTLARGRGPSGEVIAAGSQIRDIAFAMLNAARDQSLAHAPLALFALVAFVLLLFMLRS